MIPKKFKIGGCEFFVIEEDSIDDTGLGRAYVHHGMIKIARKMLNKELPQDQKEQTFCHELIHVMLDHIGRADLSEDETLVQSLALVLHQFEKTKVYD